MITNTAKQFKDINGKAMEREKSVIGDWFILKMYVLVIRCYWYYMMMKIKRQRYTIVVIVSWTVELFWRWSAIIYDQVLRSQCSSCLTRVYSWVSEYPWSRSWELTSNWSYISLLLPWLAYALRNCCYTQDTPVLVSLRWTWQPLDDSRSYHHRIRIILERPRSDISRSLWRLIIAARKEKIWRCASLIASLCTTWTISAILRWVDVRAGSWRAISPSI